MSRSLFDSYNARSLEPGQVGRGYIYSPLLRSVIERNNTAIIGPRGSGKTTLLKMLTLPALATWRDPRAKSIVEDIDYIAIYVPADFTWYPDFRRPVQGNSNAQVDDLLSYALFRSHVLLAMCETVEYMLNVGHQPKAWLTRFSISEEDGKLDKLTDKFIYSWELEPRTGGIGGLKEAISQRVKLIQYLITFASLRGIGAAELLEQNKFLAANFLDDLRGFADSFDHVYGRQFRWAACFDEVEIAPRRVKEQIWRSSRSIDQRFLIKISASPFDDDLTDMFGPKTPMGLNDYTPVYLYEQKPAEIARFSQQMFSAICSDLKLSPNRAESILGQALFDEASDEHNNIIGRSRIREFIGAAPYAPGGRHFKKFESLASKDPSFRAYLLQKNIDLTAIKDMPEVRQAAEVRKIISIVAVRDVFLFERRGYQNLSSGRKRRYRARKHVPDLYTGASSLFAMCEGNPRWLIGLLRPLLQSLRTERVQRGSLSRDEQAKRLETVITSYLALLSTIPARDGPDGGLSVVDVIDEVGEFFSNQVIGEDFRPEPILSFMVDRSTPPEIRIAVGRAVNQGAFVPIREKDKATTAGKIDGRRLRMAHLLAPLYRLPLILGRKIDLSSIVDAPHKTTSSTALLLDLFDEVRDD